MKKNHLKIRRDQKKKHLTTRSKPRAEIAIEIDLPNPQLIETLYSSLLPETREALGFRSRTRISKEDKTLKLDITADDIVALRAASNTFLRFVSVAMKTLNVVSPFYTADNQDPIQSTTGK